MSGLSRHNRRPRPITGPNRLSRRLLLQYGGRLFAGSAVFAITTGCGPVSFGPDAQNTEPVETPGAIPEPEPTPEPDPTPAPDTSPTPVPEPTPTPEPIEQVLRVAGTFFDTRHQGISELPSCPRNPFTLAGLTRINHSFEVEPAWADSFEMLEEREGWRFRIAVNSAGWSNETPVTAHDFGQHWMSLLDPERDANPVELGLLADIQNAMAYRRGEVASGEVGIFVVNDWTLEVQLEQVRESFPAAVSAMALRPRAPADSPLNEDCLTNGSYFVGSRSEENGIVLEPVDTSPLLQDTPPERIELSADSPGIALTAFQQGELHLMQLRGTNVVRVRDDPFLSEMVEEAQPNRVIMLLPDVTVPPFDRPEVRSALSLVIDRRRLELIVEGRLLPATRLLPIGMFPDFDDAAAGITADFNVDAAYAELEDALLADASEWEGFGLDIPSGIGFLDRVARDVAAQLRENLDIQVPIRVHDPEEFAAGLRERRFPLAWFEWEYPYADPASVYLELFASWRPEERPASWSHPEYDELLIAADELPAAEQRASAWAGCEGLLREHGACIPLVHPREFYLLQPWVEGIPRDARDRLIIGDTLGIDIARNLQISERPDE